MRKTILFVGDFNFYSKGNARKLAALSLGHNLIEIKHTPIAGSSLGYVPRSSVFKLGWKIGVHFDTEATNKKLLDSTKTLTPDLIWIEKGNMVHPRTLLAIKKINPKINIVSYSDDDMFNKSNRTRSYTKSLKYYDIVFVTKSYNLNNNELPALGAKYVVMVDKAFDPHQHFPIKISADEKRLLGSDVTFIGSFAPERGKTLNFLAQNGVAVKVWGNSWEQFTSQSKLLDIKCEPIVNSPKNLLFSKGIIASKINLGFLRKANRDLQTDRTIEIPACKGFLLAERSAEHERLFKHGKEAVFFDNDQDLLKKIKYFLVHEKERLLIANAGYEKCHKENYTHENRMKFMLNLALNFDKHA